MAISIVIRRHGVVMRRVGFKTRDESVVCEDGLAVDAIGIGTLYGVDHPRPGVRVKQ